jgi:hypothetical protein
MGYYLFGCHNSFVFVFVINKQTEWNKPKFASRNWKLGDVLALFSGLLLLPTPPPKAKTPTLLLPSLPMKIAFLLMIPILLLLAPCLTITMIARLLLQMEIRTLIYWAKPAVFPPTISVWSQTIAVPSSQEQFLVLPLHPCRSLERKL